MLALMFAVAQSVVLHVQLRREARSVFLSELPLVLGLLYAGPLALLAGRLVGAAVALIAVRGQFRQPLKLAFNLALAGFEVVAALWVFRLLLAGSASTPRGWAAAAVAAVGTSLLEALLVEALIGLVEGGRTRRGAWRAAGRALVQALVVTTLAVDVAAALRDDAAAVVPLLASSALLLIAYRAYASLAERHIHLEQLYRFTQELTSSPELDKVLHRVLEQARELLSAESARMLFLTTDVTPEPVEVVLRPTGVVRRPAGLADADCAWLVSRVGEQGRSVLVNRHAKDPAARRYLRRLGLRETVLVPLRGDTGVFGALAADDRMGEARGFDATDVRLLETVANHASMALRNGRLIDRLRHDSLHDALTGLPNRVALRRAVEEALPGTATGDRLLAVMLLDLDRFKDVNDTLGHQQGDLLLREVAERLVTAAGERALVARLGGDEFAVLVADCVDEVASVRLARRLVAALEEPVELAGIEVDVGGSIGIALGPKHAATASGLLKRADQAMYAAKEAARGIVVYDESMDTTRPSRLAMVSALRQAISQQHLRIELQPKISMRTGHTVSAEALVRWDSPEQGPVSPAEFVALAERSGLIRPLTSFVLDAAVSACAEWQERWPGIAVAVNLSARSLADDDLVPEVHQLLTARRLRPELLTLELTESSIMADEARMLPVLHQLDQLGVRLSIDDFGTGYSSLSHLRRLPVSEVKIDQSFVASMDIDADDAAIVRSIIELGRTLGLQVVAEGVENADQHALLAAGGCHVVQGFHLSRPLRPEAFQSWLAADSRRPGRVPPPRTTAPVSHSFR